MPLPAVHCQPCWLEARSPSTSSRMKCRAPHHHGRCRSLTRKLATIMRTRLCIQACSRSCRIPASTIGKPVRPARQASNARSRRRALGQRQRVEGPVVVAPGRVRALVQDVGVELAPGELAAVGVGRRRPPRGQVGEHRARVDRPVLEVHRHPGGALACPGGSRSVAVVARPRRPGTPPTARARPVLAGLGQGRRRPPRRPGCAPPAGRPASAAGPASSRVDASVSAGLRQPCSAQARRNGVNTRNGSPSALRTRPGATAYGDPVRTSSRPSAASALATASSRRAPYGPKSAATCTVPASTAAAIRGTTSAGSPRTTSSFPPRRRRDRAASGRGRCAGPGRPGRAARGPARTGPAPGARRRRRPGTSAGPAPAGRAGTRRRRSRTSPPTLSAPRRRRRASRRVSRRTPPRSRERRRSRGRYGATGPFGAGGRASTRASAGRSQAASAGGSCGPRSSAVNTRPSSTAASSAAAASGSAAPQPARACAASRRSVSPPSISGGAQLGLAHRGQAQLVAGQRAAPLRGGHRHPDPGQHVQQRRRAGAASTAGSSTARSSSSSRATHPSTSADRVRK